MFTSAIFALLFAIATQTFPAPRVEASELSKEELQAIAMADATSHHIDIAKFLGTIGCESHWNIDAVSNTGDYGIAQINIKSWDMSKESALDPIFSLDFMAKQFATGGAHYWVCYNKIHEKDLLSKTL